MSDARTHLVIAIDGPAAAGKSSTAQWVAKQLGIHHVDSGALYRAAAAARIRGGQPPEHFATWDPADLSATVSRISTTPDGPTFAPLIDGERCDNELRSPTVTRAVSAIARIHAVRLWVNEQVQRLAREFDVVVDGRDIGTVVLPAANLKIFLVADPWERARRRLIQRESRHPSDTEIAEETDRLVQRDAADALQTIQAPDAVRIDSTALTQEEQVERIVALARAASHRAPA